jgi:hypothetical protein
MADGPVSAVTNRDELAMHVESALAHIADSVLPPGWLDHHGEPHRIA